MHVEKTVIAESNVVLFSKRGEETNFGNLITDSMVRWVSTI